MNASGERTIMHNARGTSVVAGVDGSPAALHAATWAAQEAVVHDVPLRLIHVVQSTAADVRRDVSEGEAALSAAREAALLVDRDLQVEITVVRGPVAATLVSKSADAVMICLGSTGCPHQALKYAGAVGTAVIRSASVPVAIVGFSSPTAVAEVGDVAVLVDDPVVLDSLADVGLREARLRRAALLFLNLTSTRRQELTPEDVDRRLTELAARHLDVPTAILMTPDDVAAFVAARDTPPQLIIVGNPGGSATENLVGPYGRFILRGTPCTVLVVCGRG